MILGEEKQVLSAYSNLCGRALYHRVHNYASRQTAGSQQSVWIFGSLLTNSQSRLGLTGCVIFLTVVSSLLTRARLYEFFRHLSTTCDTHLPIPLSAFGIDLTLPLQWPDTSLGTLHLLLEPQLYPTSMCGANCKIIDIC